MRIALVCPYSCTVPGGVQTQVLGLARALGSGGDDVAVVGLADGSRMAGRLDAAGLQGASFVKVGGSLSISVNGSRAPVSPLPTTMVRTLSALRRFRPEVVHVHEPFVPGPSLAAVSVGPRPVVATFHRSGDDLVYRAFGRLAGGWARRIDAAFAVSTQACETARRCIPQLAGRLSVIENGVEATGAGEIEPWPTLAPTIAFVGRHEHRKGLEVLLEAFSLVPAPARLWVMGAGPETARLRSRFGSEERIEWVGAPDDGERRRRLAGADIFVAPSLGGESFGVVLLEAMAAGTAVVASDIAGYRLAAAGAARLVPPGDPAALAAALVDLLGVEQDRQALVELGLRRAAECDMAVVAARYREVYSGLLGSGRE
jgi:phosphatidylinositol alpha-mannosyltransferase